MNHCGWYESLGITQVLKSISGKRLQEFLATEVCLINYEARFVMPPPFLDPPRQPCIYETRAHRMSTVCICFHLHIFSMSTWSPRGCFLSFPPIHFGSQTLDTHTIALTPRQYRSHMLRNLGCPPISQIYTINENTTSTSNSCYKCN